MVRVITSATYRHYQEMERSAGKAAGLEAELATAKERYENLTERAVDNIARLDAVTAERDNVERERDTLRAALDKVVAALVGHKDAGQARRMAAEHLLRHSESAELALLAQGPTVFILFRHGKAQSAHATMEDGRKEADFYAELSGGRIQWNASGKASDDGAGRVLPPNEFVVMSLAVKGAWPDRSRVHLLTVDGHPQQVFGTKTDAHTAALVFSPLTPRVVELTAEPVWPTKTSAPDAV